MDESKDLKGHAGHDNVTQQTRLRKKAEKIMQKLLFNMQNCFVRNQSCILKKAVAPEFLCIFKSGFCRSIFNTFAVFEICQALH